MSAKIITLEFEGGDGGHLRYPYLRPGAGAIAFSTNGVRLERLAGGEYQMVLGLSAAVASMVTDLIGMMPVEAPPDEMKVLTEKIIEATSVLTKACRLITEPMAAKP